MRCFVLMGVSGCGKSSVGQALARDCGLAFIDGDDLHPQTNIDKMAQGRPLTDADRMPWLRQVGDALAAADGPVVIGCSALKRSYRDAIRGRLAEPVAFLHLDAPQHVLQARVTARRDHFMPPALLDSQYAALQALGEDETGSRIDIDQPLAAVVAQAAACVNRWRQ